MFSYHQVEQLHFINYYQFGLSDPIACMTTTMTEAESIFPFVERRPAIRH